MKIRGKKPGVEANKYVSKQRGTTPASKSVGVHKASEADNVNISPKAKELNRIKSMVQSVPEVRGKRVIRLKTDIANGDYNIDAEKVAEKMIERALKDTINSNKKNIEKS